MTPTRPTLPSSRARPTGWMLPALSLIHICLAYVGITRAKKELYISNSVTRMLYGRTQRNEPSRILREIEPEYIEETRSPVLEQRSRLGGWGSSYSDTVPLSLIHI